MAGRRFTAAILALAASSMFGCASPASSPGEPSDVAAAPPTPSSPARNLAPQEYDGRYRTTATVLEDPRHGPQLCYATTYSLPPQCEGPDVLGWDWSALPAESVRGTRWGNYELVGTFTDGSFTLTEPAVVADGRFVGEGAALTPLPTSESPCAEQASGQTPTGSAPPTEGATEQARARAGALPGFAAFWLSSSDRDPGVANEETADGQHEVANVSTAGEPAEAYAAVREVWRGALCVREVPRSEADLGRIQAALPELPGWFSSGSDVQAGVVHFAVVHGTQEQQHAFDDEFGVGTVLLTSQLKPID